MKMGKASIRQRFTVVIVACVLCPFLAFWIWRVDSWQREQIAGRSSQLTQDAEELRMEAEKTLELCQVSTQAFLSNNRLVEYLQGLSNGETFTAGQLYDFSVNDIASMERMVVSNPDLYRIRVYTCQRLTQEMMPVLFGQERLQEIGWEEPMPESSQWWLNYTDQMFNANIPGLMALLSPIYADDGNILGTLEVSVPMGETFPDLFDSRKNACLVSESGQMIGVSQESFLPELLDEVPQVQADVTVWETRMDGTPVLAASIVLEDLNCVYYTVESLEDLYRDLYNGQIFLSVAVLTAVIAIWLLAKALVRQMLRQLYLVLDGVQAFSQGETDIKIPIESHDEIGQFAGQINLLLDSIQDLIRRQIQGQVLLKDTQIHALQNQINAHFLYNTLEAIKMMAQIAGQDDIVEAISDLSKLLHYTMGWKRPVVQLAEEIDYIRHYLALVNLRYDGQVSLVVQVPQELMSQAVPKVSLQPIVENAVVHGGPLRQDRTILLRVWEDGDRVCLTIAQEGFGPSEEDLLRMQQSIDGVLKDHSRSGNGIGLHNIQERIQHTFGKQFGLSAENGITMTLPRKETETGGGKK